MSEDAYEEALLTISTRLHLASIFFSSSRALSLTLIGHADRQGRQQGDQKEGEVALVGGHGGLDAFVWVWRGTNGRMVVEREGEASLSLSAFFRGPNRAALCPSASAPLARPRPRPTPLPTPRGRLGDVRIGPGVNGPPPAPAQRRARRRRWGRGQQRRCRHPAPLGRPLLGRRPFHDRRPVGRLARAILPWARARPRPGLPHARPGRWRTARRPPRRRRAAHRRPAPPHPPAGRARGAPGDPGRLQGAAHLPAHGRAL